MCRRGFDKNVKRGLANDSPRHFPAYAGRRIHVRRDAARSQTGPQPARRGCHFRRAMKSSIGMAAMVSIFTLPREAISADTRIIVALSGASTMFTKS